MEETEDVPCPLVLTCKITGKKTTYTNKDYIRERIRKAGGLERLLSSYIAKGSGPKRQRAKDTWGGQPVLTSSSDAPRSDPPPNCKCFGSTLITSGPAKGLKKRHREYRFGGVVCTVYEEVPLNAPD